MKIAVVGAGISGLVTAYLLCEDHEITVFEANDYIGGHTHTLDVPWDGRTYAVDTGFIVFNEKTYPNFLKLLRRLGVAWQPSKMSFSVTSEKNGLEYSPTSLNALFAQRRNLFRPAFYRMVLDIFRFRQRSLRILGERGDDTTLGDYLKAEGYSKAFIHDFIIPMGAAIWSADPDQFWHFPARFFVRFFHNHGFLKVTDQPQWLVIEGGSRNYVRALTGGFVDAIRLSCPVNKVVRHEDRVEIFHGKGPPEAFDQVVMAAHSDQALRLLADPSEAEVRILGAMPYQENVTVLHTDETVLPKKQVCWASWNYHVPRAQTGRVAVTYDMNILQSLTSPVEFCVSLNHPGRIDPERVIDRMVYHHPVYTPDSLKAQQGHQEINGRNRTSFCGAYWGFGFHEDGVKSALAVCERFGKRL
ncbi:MAG: FAD-dependent oxidoreductase [Thermodesulfobacteriota bacterium]|nr:FAD-dependent oxidoreductase [Thermodesulfobacteriota bacterium]